MTGYQITSNLYQDLEAIDLIKRQKGRFILSTNELDYQQLADHEILIEYKAQSGTEKGFKFIKNNTFEVDSVFLKAPHRIEALMMIMTLCLMVYGVAEVHLRESLKKTGDTVLNQLRKPTTKPSMKWVYFLFLGVQEFHVHLGENRIQTIVVNVNENLKGILKYFGPRARAVYLNTG